MVTYHFCATYQSGTVDGIGTFSDEIKTKEDYNQLKERISDDYFGGVASDKFTVTSLSLISK